MAEASAARPGGPGTVEWAAIGLLLVGGFAIPVAGWVLGVGLLWISRAWTPREKLVGTLVPPGGLLAPFAVMVAASSFTLQLSSLAAACLLVALCAVPVWTAVFLARRARRPLPAE
jgi:hypothetical protein